MPNNYANALQAVADEHRKPGEFTGDIANHAANFKNLAQVMQPVMGDTLTSGVLQGAGFANEGLDAIRGFLNPSKQVSGFDQSDLVANKVGIDEGIRQANAGPKNVMGALAGGAGGQIENIMKALSERNAKTQKMKFQKKVPEAAGGLQGVLAALGGSM